MRCAKLSNCVWLGLVHAATMRSAVADAAIGQRLNVAQLNLRGALVCTSNQLQLTQRDVSALNIPPVYIVLDLSVHAPVHMRYHQHAAANAQPSSIQRSIGALPSSNHACIFLQR